MGALILIVLLSVIITGVLYRIGYSISPFKRLTRGLTPVQQFLCWVVVLYVPVQLFLLYTIGSYLPIISPDNHPTFAVLFTSSHAILAVMGMVMSMFFYKRNNKAVLLLTANAACAIVYIAQSILFLTQ